MKIGKTLGALMAGLVIFAGPFSMSGFLDGNSPVLSSQSLYAAEVVRSLSLEERVERLERQMETRNKILADLQFKLNDMQEEVRTLLGTQEENNYNLKQLTERQREIYKDVDTRLTEAQQQIESFLKNNQSGTSKSPTAYSASLRPQNPPPQKPQKAVTQTVHSSVEETRAYEQIFPLVREKKYVKAISAYQAFIAKYPKGKFTINAHYWLGQVHFVQGQLDEAAVQFKLIKNNYPQSRKVADAMLKLAIIHQRHDELKQAKSIYQQIIKDYPGTSTARLADRRLKEIP